MSNEVAAYVAQVTFLHHYVGFGDVLGEAASTARAAGSLSRRLNWLATKESSTGEASISGGMPADPSAMHWGRARWPATSVGLEREWDNDGIPDAGAGVKGVEASSP